MNFLRQFGGAVGQWRRHPARVSLANPRCDCTSRRGRHLARLSRGVRGDGLLTGAAAFAPGRCASASGLRRPRPRMTKCRPRCGTLCPHHRLGDSDGPLTGLRVVELASIAPARCARCCWPIWCECSHRPHRTSGLACHGHQVRRLGPQPALGAGHQAKRGRDAALRLIDRADVLIEAGARRGRAAGLGRGCLARNPGLVFGRMTGFADRPLPRRRHDLNYIALTGALHAIVWCGGQDKPVPPLNLVATMRRRALPGVRLLAAIFERGRSGQGRWWTRRWSMVRRH